MKRRDKALHIIEGIDMLSKRMKATLEIDKLAYYFRLLHDDRLFF